MDLLKSLSKEQKGNWPLHLLSLILKLAGILWNRTSVEVVGKLSSTYVDFIRSEREMGNMHLYGV